MVTAGRAWPLVVGPALGLGITASALLAQVLPEGSFARGAPNAPLTVIEYGDLGCSACAQFATETFPALDAAFIQTGRVRWLFVPIVLGHFRHSDRAARAAVCAGDQDAFFAMHDRLYGDQRHWQRTRRPDGIFREFAAEVGLDTTAFAQCYDAKETKERVERVTRSVRPLPIIGTPAFQIGGRWAYGALTERDFAAIVHEEVEKAVNHGRSRPKTGNDGDDLTTVLARLRSSTTKHLLDLRPPLQQPFDIIRQIPRGIQVGGHALHAAGAGLHAKQVEPHALERGNRFGHADLCGVALRREVVLELPPFFRARAAVVGGEVGDDRIQLFHTFAHRLRVRLESPNDGGEVGQRLSCGFG